MNTMSFIKVMAMIVGASLGMSVTATAQGSSDEVNPCISTDSNLGDSAFWSNTAMDLYTQERYVEAVNTVDACFNQWASGAVTLQQSFNSQKVKEPPLGDFTASEKKEIQENYLLNDVSVALWVKARSLDELDETELAKKTYANCIYLTHGRAWDPKGWFWSPSADCIKMGRKLL